LAIDGADSTGGGRTFPSSIPSFRGSLTRPQPIGDEHQAEKAEKQVERLFALITEHAIRRNSFTSVRELKQQIELFVQRYNADTSPFQWVAIADSIPQKIERIAKRISATEHSYGRRCQWGR